MRSDKIKKGINRAPQRSLIKACGVMERDLNKPFIGIANSYVDIIPGHTHLQEFGKILKESVRTAGGVPFEFNTIGICDGIAMGHFGMRYSLPSRELIADSIETMVQAHQFDGLICLGNCDKIVPGMLMAMVRMNIPSIYVSGGPMKAGKCGQAAYGESMQLPGMKESLDLISVFEALGSYKTGKISESQLKMIEENACPGVGSCAGMFTANSMNSIAEVMGIAFPGNGTVLAIDSVRKSLLKVTGQQIINLVKQKVKPRDIITPASIDNAFALDMALGGSTNTVLHLLAIANEAKLDYPLERINKIAERVPYICKISPADPNVHMEDLDQAGGISVILKELVKREGLLNLNCLTVTLQSLGENLRLESSLSNDSTFKERFDKRGREIVRTIDNAFSDQGGLMILFGNLAPDGAVVKAGSIEQEARRFVGSARVFNSQGEALAAIDSNKIEDGDVIVIRYEGPRGGPGMPEMLEPTSKIVGMGLGKKVALITDGRFSGGTRGISIGHISPEAAAQGPIAALQDGDVIKIDINNQSIEVELTDQEIAMRLSKLKEWQSTVETGWLNRYARMVQSANTGAVLK